jgi:hypothetical protein
MYRTVNKCTCPPAQPAILQQLDSPMMFTLSSSTPAALPAAVPVRGRRATVVRHTVPAPARKVTCQVRALPRSLRHSLSARRQP